MSTRTSTLAQADSAGLPSRVPVGDSSPTRQKLLETAEALFHAEGFHEVGLKRILREVGITKQGFYRHFDSKEDLVADVIRWHDRWWRDNCRQILADRAGPDARRQLDAFVGLIIEALEGDVFRGCFFMNAVAQFPSKSDPIHQAALKAKDNIEALVRDMALGAGADDPAAFARELSMIFEGGFATRHLRPPEDVVPVLRRMAAALFEQRLRPVAGA
ncbi:MAG TPA: TetR/AcrR family transcriptional regulator [Planctomycetaceae bacterium]|nr:TetR/AcrR family transcriptional regulator [Planctomycetaceae bacterium]